jgi:hypothetical protein
MITDIMHSLIGQSHYFIKIKALMKITHTFLKISTLLLISSISLFNMTSCATSKQSGWLASHKKALSEAANSTTMKPEEKADILMSHYAQMMDEGLKFVNPVKGATFITKYQEENQASIVKIVAESNGWVGNLNTMQGIDLGLRVAKKPYIPQYIDLIPKFKKKYNQYKFVMDMTGKVVGAFGKIGKLASLAF